MNCDVGGGQGRESRTRVEMSDPDDFLDINCGGCGTPLKVRIAHLGDARFVECEACAGKPPFNKRKVFVVFEERLNG
jgi:hypothetical protein